jgi:hypothetical protein
MSKQPSVRIQTTGRTAHAHDWKISCNTLGLHYELPRCEFLIRMPGAVPIRQGRSGDSSGVPIVQCGYPANTSAGTTRTSGRTTARIRPLTHERRSDDRPTGLATPSPSLLGGGAGRAARLHPSGRQPTGRLRGALFRLGARGSRPTAQAAGHHLPAGARPLHLSDGIGVRPEPFRGFPPQGTQGQRPGGRGAPPVGRRHGRGALLRGSGHQGRLRILRDARDAQRRAPPGRRRRHHLRHRAPGSLDRAPCATDPHEPADGHARRAPDPARCPQLCHRADRQ